MKVDIPISGMSCASCVANVERIVKRVDGVQDASANLATQQATVEYDPRRVSLVDIVSALRQGGYPAEVLETSVAIAGMHCASCVTSVEKTITNIPGVVDVKVNIASETGRIRHVGVKDLESRLNALFRSGGYKVTIIADPSGSPAPGADETGGVRRPLLVSVVIALFLTGYMAAGHVGWIALKSPLSGLVQLPFAMIVYFWAGLRFHRGLIHAVKRRSPDMDTLISLGTSAAFWYSLIVLIWPRLFYDSPAQAEYYFDSTVMIITLILLGRFLEARAKSRSAAAIRKLLEARPADALVRREGVEVSVPSASLAPHDIVIVKPGAGIPADGKITTGNGSIDESMLTGEPLPIDKGSGEEVTGGTINISGSFDFMVTAYQSESRLNQIAELVMAALGSKPRIQRLVDRVAGVFVPVVIVIALSTLVVWLALGSTFPFALKALIAVLIIACPCALGLATPTAIMVASGRAASLGFYFKSAETLEQIGKLSTLFWDKTGTLTEGRFEVVAVKSLDLPQNDLLRIVAAVEQRSEHLLARAIVEYAGEQGVKPAKVDNFRSLAGIGAAGAVEGREVLLGTEQLMAQNDIDMNSLADVAEEQLQQGRTLVYVAIAGRLQGLIGLADKVKDDASDAVAAVKQLGIHNVMITGDNGSAAEAVAAKLGVDEIDAQLLPEQKLEIIKRRQEKGEFVGMVGDGINDAPALALADVGIALGSGSDIAIESALVTITSGEVGNVARVIRLARATLRNIKQNLFWAFFYNVLAIPIAAGVFYPVFKVQLSPIIGAATMACSSIFVVSNALRLRRFR